MKSIFLFLLGLLPIFCLSSPGAGIELPIIYIHSGSTVHLLSPEDISYVDLPNGKLKGDLPLKNLLRIRPSEGLSAPPAPQDLGILTLTGETFLAQFRLVLLPISTQIAASSSLEILPEHMQPLHGLQPRLSMNQIRSRALDMLSMKSAKPALSKSAQGVSISLNRVLLSGELMFLDIGFSNSSNLDFEVAALEFLISDKKIFKAQNFQEFSLEPKLSLQPVARFSRQARNIIVLPRATFSSAKRLLISLKETQPSSRNITLELNYGDILNADSF